jgi:hypothetical protein
MSDQCLACQQQREQQLPYQLPHHTCLDSDSEEEEDDGAATSEALRALREITVTHPLRLGVTAGPGDKETLDRLWQWLQSEGVPCERVTRVAEPGGFIVSLEIEVGEEDEGLRALRTFSIGAAEEGLAAVLV